VVLGNTYAKVRPGAQAPGLLRVVPKMVASRAAFVVGVVPYDPKVTRSGHGARHVRVVVSHLLPSRVVLYRESIAHAVWTMYVAEIASDR